MLTYPPDTRIAQSLVIEARPTKGQLEARLTALYFGKRRAEARSTDRAHDLTLDVFDLVIAETKVEITCRQIEDVEIELIAFAHELESHMRNEERIERIVARLRIFCGDREFELEQLHRKLMYLIRDRDRLEWVTN